MSTTERDYYEVLGVPRNADEQAIKKAFRRLARELHPDVSEHPEAEARFREATEAYEALSNPETRQLYDRYGHAGLRSGGFQPTNFDLGTFGDLFSAFFGDDVFGPGGRRGRGASRGADLVAEVEISLVEAAHGIKVTIPFEAAVTCRTCHGDGAAPGATPVTCPRCGGSGLLQQVSRGILGEFVRQMACPECNGAGRRIDHPARRATAPAGRSRSAPSRSRFPRASTTASASASRARATPAVSAAGRVTRTSGSRSVPTTGSCARGTTSSPRST